jgi:hypothetical protein
MAATTTADLVATRYRKETADTDAASYFVDGDLLLEFLQDAVREYSRHRPIHTQDTITVVKDQVDYGAPAGSRRVKAIRDLTDGAVDPPWIDFEVIEVDGKQIRLVGTLPQAGRVLTVYFTQNHAKPADLTSGTTLTVDDDDVRYLLLWMKALRADMKAGQLVEGGSWKVGQRSEDHSKGGKSTLQAGESFRKQFMTAMAEGTTLYGAGYPIDEHVPPRPVLTGASRYQGHLGWTGQHPGQRRRGL